MATKSIRISEDTYKRLLKLAGKLQVREKKSISIEDAITHLLSRRIGDLAGSWDMDQEEADEIMESINTAWKNW
ncbi:MAG: hypothetical protein ACTSUE_15435 [Promethearchaeota archaeon]